MGERAVGDGQRAVRRSLGDEDPPASHGAALGAGGIDGWWAWKNRRQMRRAMDAASPATGRGALHVALWFAGMAAITVVGPLIAAWPRPVWFVVALVVMGGVGWLWDHRGQRPEV